MTAAALTITGLCIAAPDGKRLVDDVTIAAPCAGTLTLVGETGSGKSLVAQALFGLLPRSLSVSGRIAFGTDEPIAASDRTALARYWRRPAMLLPQEPAQALDPTMRIGRQLELAGGKGYAAAAALGAVDLPAATAAAFPFELSGGMAQRVLVASALAGGAAILVADEPTKGLDRERVGQAVDLLRSLEASGRSLLLITHDLAVARGVPGLVAVMHEGRLVETGPTLATLSRPRAAYTRALVAADPARWARDPRVPRDGAPLLRAADVAFGWPGCPGLLSGVNLALPAGGITALTGPSGCGKSTLANVLLGLLRPHRGLVRWGSSDPYADPRARRGLRRRYQKLHQDPVSAFAPHRRIGKQLCDLARVVPDADLAARLPPLLDRLRLKSELLERYPAEISGGEAQRLALARLLLVDPAVIVADEPTSRLDPILQRETIVLLRELVERDHLALLLISHDDALVRAVADTVIDLPARAGAEPARSPDMPAPDRKDRALAMLAR